MTVTTRRLLPPGGLFPRRMRDLPGGRWTRIGLRTLHLIGVTGLGAAYLYPVEPALWHPYLLITLISGLLLMLSEVWAHGIWLIQLRGVAIFIKCAVLGAGLILDDAWSPLVLLIVVAISGVIAHAPGRLRYFSPWHGQVYTYDDWLQQLEQPRANEPQY